MKKDELFRKCQRSFNDFCTFERVEGEEFFLTRMIREDLASSIFEIEKKGLREEFLEFYMQELESHFDFMFKIELTEDCGGFEKIEDTLFCKLFYHYTKWIGPKEIIEDLVEKLHQASCKVMVDLVKRWNLCDSLRKRGGGEILNEEF